MRTSQGAIKAKERQAEALRLRSQGLDYSSIANKLGLSRSGAHKAVSVALKQLTSEEAKELRQIELSRLDQLQTVFWDKAIDGDLPSAAMILRIQERRAKLCGLDAPSKLVAANVSLNYENMLRELAGMREANPALLNAEETS